MPYYSQYYDSTGQLIKVGDIVRFRGVELTIAKFVSGEGRLGTASIRFEEVQTNPELADEISVDLIQLKI